MPMVFPSSPTVGQVFSSGGRSWVWTGSTWDSPAGSPFVAPGLVLVKSQTIGTAVSSVTVSDAFSADYDNYVVSVSAASASATTFLSLALNNGNSNYAYGRYNITFSNQVFASTSATNGSNLPFIGSLNPNTGHSYLEIYEPFLTRFTTVLANRVSNGGSDYIMGQHQVSISHTGFTILVSSGTITGGIINVYGYRKA